MSSRYQKAFTIPDGFPQILKSFTREILRSQPENIYTFGASYFEGKMLDNAKEHERRARGTVDGGSGGTDDEQMTQEMEEQKEKPGLLDMSDAELAEFVTAQFARYDVDGDGFLDLGEFKLLLSDAELGLSKKEMRAVMQEADANDDGVLEYTEFVPVMVEIIHGLQARALAAETAEVDAQHARESVTMHLLHGISRDELEEMMRAVFAAADVDGSGSLDRKEFARCLKHAQLSLTRKEINLLLLEVDTNVDGLISYDEFTPLCFNILVERFKDDVLAEQAMASSDSLTLLLLEEFETSEREAFPEDDALLGQLPFAMVKACLKVLSEEMLGLSKLQLSAVMSESRCDETHEDRMVEYTLFAPIAAAVIHSMVGLSSQKKRMDAIGAQQLVQTSEDRSSAVNSLLGDPDSVKTYINNALADADFENTGILDVKDVTQILRRFGDGELNLSANQINALVAAVDADDDGNVEYGELPEFLFEVLAHLERETYIQANAFSGGEGE